jgi:hypothetical protein
MISKPTLAQGPTGAKMEGHAGLSALKASIAAPRVHGTN